jgi:hypothetical protein
MIRVPFLLCVLAATLSSCASAPSRTSELAVRRTWDEYLASKKGQYGRYAGEPSPLWDATEQRMWPMYDLAGFYLADGAIPEVLSVTRVGARADTAYQIITRFWPQGTTTRDSSTVPELTMTVYARRDAGRWVLANALRYKTASWRRETRGRVTFRVAPTLQYSDVRATRAAAFVDSLASTFNVAPPPRLDYYSTESVDQALEILGVVIPRRFGAGGGFAKPVNFQVFSGIPNLGEEYRHEIAHVILLPIIRGSSTSLLASEGVPTWFGGTAGRDYRSSVRYLDSVLTAQPQLTLDKVLDDMSVPSEVRNAAGAVLAEMLHETGGVEAVREYLRTPERGIRDVLMRSLQRPWREVSTTWRDRVHRIAAT